MERINGLTDKDTKTLKQELANEYKTIDKNDKFYNKELHESAINVAKKTVSQLFEQKKKITDLNFDPETRAKYEAQRKKMDTEIRQHTKLINNTDYVFGKHETHLNVLANIIDNGENEILALIESLARKQEIKKTKEAIGANYFTEGKDGSLTLTAATNAPRIDQVLGKLIQTGKVWKIDYSGCTNPKYKEIMINAMGGVASGTISQGIDAEGHTTFVVKSLDGKLINQRAIIREGVTLTPSTVLVDNAITEQNNKTNKLKNIDIRTKFKQASELGKYPGLAKALGNKTEKFITLAEEKLHNTIVYAKKHGWELHSEPITKNWTGNAILDIHLVNGTGEKDFGLFNEQTTDKVIYDILNGNEGDLVKYMTARLKQKWNEYGHLDKVNTVAVGMQEKGKQTTMLNDNQKEQVKNGLQGLNTMVNNMIDAEGDTKLGTRDEKLRALSSYLRDVTAAVSKGKNLTQYDIDTFSAQISKLYKKAYNLNSTSSSRDGIETQRYDTKKEVKTILLGTSAESRKTLRFLGERVTLLANTNTSFLADEIANDKNNLKDLEIEKTDINTCFHRIESLFAGDDDRTIGNIEQMYKYLDSSEKLFTYLQKNAKIIPSGAAFENGLLRSDGRKARVEQLHKQLQESKASLHDETKKSEIATNIKNDRKEEKRILEGKATLTEEEMTRLHVLHVYENMPAGGDAEIKKLIENIGYLGVANAMRSTVGGRLVKEGGGFTKGANKDIYNDILGAGGLLNFSDQNAQTTQIMVRELAFMLIGMGAGMAIAKLSAALVRGTIAAKNVTTIVKLSRMEKFKNIFKLGNAAQAAVDAQKVAKIAEITAKNATVYAKTATYFQKANIAFSPTRPGVVSNILGGVGYASTINTLSGSWDDTSVADFTKEALFGSVLIGSIKGAELMFQGRNVSHAFRRFITEEIAINPVDIASSRIIGKPQNPGEIGQNLALGAILELFPALAGRRFRPLDAQKAITDQLKTPEGKAIFEEKVLNTYEGVKNLNEKKGGAYAKDANKDIMKAERDRLNKVVEKLVDGDPKKEKINNAVRKLEERINNFKSPEKIADAEKYLQEVEANLQNVSPKRYKKIWDSLQAIFTKFPKLSAAYVGLRQSLGKLLSLSNKNREGLQSSKYGMEVIRVNDLLMHADDALLTPSMKAFKAMDEKTSVDDMRKAIEGMQSELKALKFTNTTGKNAGKLIGVDGVIGENTANALQKYLGIKKGQAEVNAKGKVKPGTPGGEVSIEIKSSEYGYDTPEIKAFAEKFGFTKEQIEGLTPEQRKELFTMLTNDPIHAAGALAWDESAKIWVQGLLKYADYVRHDFGNLSNLRLSNQSTILAMEIGSLYHINVGRGTYAIFKNINGETCFVSPGNPPKTTVLEVNKEYIIGRNHRQLTGLISDNTVSREHMSIQINQNGKIVVRDLKSTNATVIEKKGINPNRESTIMNKVDVDLHNNSGGQVLLQKQYVNYTHNGSPLVIEMGNQTVHILKLADHPDLVQYYGLDVNKGFVLANLNLMMQTRGKDGFSYIENGQLILGRQNSHNVIDVSDTTISRNHINITRQGDAFTINDMSTNGTSVRADRNQSSLTRINSWVRQRLERSRLAESDLVMNDEERMLFNKIFKRNRALYDQYKNSPFLLQISKGLQDINARDINIDVKQLPRIDLKSFNRASNLDGLDINVYKLLSNTFGEKNLNTHYCTMSIPTFITSIANHQGVKFIDSQGSTFYTKYDASVKTTLKISQDGNVSFGGVSDAAFKVGYFVHKNIGKLGIGNTNKKLKEMGLPFVVKKNNGQVEIHATEQINFQSVTGQRSANTYDGSYRRALEGRVEETQLFTEFSGLVKGLDQLNSESITIDNIIMVFDGMSKLKVNQVFSYGKNDNALKLKRHDGINDLYETSIGSENFGNIVQSLKDPTSILFRSTVDYLQSVRQLKSPSQLIYKIIQLQSQMN